MKTPFEHRVRIRTDIGSTEIHNYFFIRPFQGRNQGSLSKSSLILFGGSPPQSQVATQNGLAHKPPVTPG